VNPARSTGPALFVGHWALSQLWLFWVAPVLGAIIGAVIYRYVLDEDSPIDTDLPIAAAPLQTSQG
jgi:aquaporin Z